MSILNTNQDADAILKATAPLVAALDRFSAVLEKVLEYKAVITVDVTKK